VKKKLVQATLIMALAFLFSCKGNENQSQGNAKDSLNAKTATAQDTTKAKTVYVCPMHPEEKSDKPGKCSICGMDLEPQS
jgi:hypothetical protein